MTPPEDLVFLLDIEDGLLDHNWIELDLRPHQSDQPVRCAAGMSRSHCKPHPRHHQYRHRWVRPVRCLAAATSSAVYVGDARQPRGSDIVALGQGARGPRSGTEWPARRRGHPVSTPPREEVGGWQP
jgi:hypothetical protein